MLNEAANLSITDKKCEYCKGTLGSFCILQHMGCPHLSWLRVKRTLYRVLVCPCLGSVLLVTRKDRPIKGQFYDTVSKMPQVSSIKVIKDKLNHSLRDEGPPLTDVGDKIQLLYC